MKIVVGLGNPGTRYEATPHNLGFVVVDRLAQRAGADFRPLGRIKALGAEARLAGQPVLLVKPQTFMNLSGDAVAELLRQRERREDDLLVITDDVNLPIGRLRIRPSGGPGGHNGLRSLIARLGGDDFSRLRIGIQPTWPVDDLVAFVLRKLPPLEREQLAEMAELAADAAELWLREGTTAAAEKFNGLRRFAPPADAPDADRGG
ncbi:MAG TPA: aminoacyl-tRNA hydrolase [Candidatus Sumerlaeota bacterium]|nr:aminoacyl-tRNA hydrolase [Candidatus Sumerlaeota bacterium]HOR29368.1 aminoacyl-tRNA hydrolase [Candidatus Sumerlaeota bacterium]